MDAFHQTFAEIAQNIWRYCHIFDKQLHKWCSRAIALSSTHRLTAGIFVKRRELHSLSSVNIRNTHRGNPVCVYSKRQGLLSSAGYPKILGRWRKLRGGFHPSVNCQRYEHTCTNISPKRQQTMLTTNLTGPHGENHTAGSGSKHNPLVYLNPHGFGHVDIQSTVGGLILSIYCFHDWHARGTRPHREKVLSFLVTECFGVK